MDEDEALIANYDELRRSRDWTWDQMADTLPHDRRLAAVLRKQATPEAPKGRSAGGASQTAAK